MARGKGEGAGEGKLHKGSLGGGEGGRRGVGSPCVLSSGLFALEGPPVNSFLPRGAPEAGWRWRVLAAGRWWPGREAPAHFSYLAIQGVLV